MLEILFFIISTIATSLTGVFALGYNGPIYILYYILIFIGLYILSFLIFLLYFYILGRFVNMNKTYDRPNPYYEHLMYVVVRFVLFVCRIKVKCIYNESLPNEPFLLVQNHKNGLDPLCTMHALRHERISFITKKENMKLPFISRFMHRACFIALDRDNPRNGIKAIATASKLISDTKLNIGVYPEGTRNRTDETLLEFKDGCFKAALKSECPIVVTTLTNTNKIGHLWPIKRNTITFSVLKVLKYEEFKDLTTPEISDLTKNIMLQELKK